MSARGTSVRPELPARMPEEPMSKATRQGSPAVATAASRQAAMPASRWRRGVTRLEVQVAHDAGRQAEGRGTVDADQHPALAGEQGDGGQRDGDLDQRRGQRPALVN